MGASFEPRKESKTVNAAIKIRKGIDKMKEVKEKVFKKKDD